MDWKEIYRFPLIKNEYAPFMVETIDGIRAFDFEWEAWEEYDKDGPIADEHIKDLIIEKLNGNKSIIIEELYNFKYDDDGNVFAFDTKNQKLNHILMIRGWGHLNGTLGLSATESAKIQDDFGKYIVETLNH